MRASTGGASRRGTTHDQHLTTERLVPPATSASSPLRLVVLMSIASPWSREVVRHLTQLGVAVHIVELQPRGAVRGYIEHGRAKHSSAVDELEQHAASVHRVATPRWMPRRLWSSAAAVARIARECDADAMLTLYGGSLAATAYLSRVRPYIVYAVGSDVLLASSLERVVARIALTRSAAVLANGDHLARRTIELAPHAHVTAHLLGVDLSEYAPSPIATGRRAFVCTRGFVDVYDNGTIVRALGRLRDVPSDFSVSFLSSGPLLAETERLADEVVPATWRSRVVFHGGVSHEQLKKSIQSSSFYVSASRSDGTSASLLEAMASGLIPIVSDIPANREWIEHDRNGLLFKPGDDGELATALARAIAYERWMDGAREANRRLVETRADARANMTTLRDILRTHSRRVQVAPTTGVA